ncbi:uncharacterized protein C10orf95-like [Poecile atricapillus]|uniref:uncharacterized protein C10orf95-like n=1 Tax=Poecile atricapillus TaxID=48891 RepID=UPI00273A4A07|nr:uncharacterized protein C10orf95-like [Poecile atricapillus]
MNRAAILPGGLRSPARRLAGAQAVPTAVPGGPHTAPAPAPVTKYSRGSRPRSGGRGRHAAGSERPHAPSPRVRSPHGAGADTCRHETAVKACKQRRARTEPAARCVPPPAGLHSCGVCREGYSVFSPVRTCGSGDVPHLGHNLVAPSLLPQPSTKMNLLPVSCGKPRPSVKSRVPTLLL